MTSLQITGWDIVDDDGLLIATRRAPLTEYQRLNGAITEVTARDAGELWILCDAHNRLAQRIAAAEAARHKVTPFRRTRPLRPMM